jgi:hypothetical protein
MDTNISKDDFCRTMNSLSRNERLDIANALCVACVPRLGSQLIPGALQSEIIHVRSRVIRKKKCNTLNLWKLWVFAMKPHGDLKNWRMTGTQCYRTSPPGSGKRWSRPLTNQTRTRRPTIRDVNGDVVPRRWLDRFAPHVKTQEDWDQNSIYKNKA